MFFQIIHAIRFPDWINDTAFSLGPLSIKWYGISYIIGIMAAYYYARRTVDKKDIWIPSGMTRGSEIVPTKQMLEDFAFYCMLGIIIGGRLGSVILYDLGKYIQDPIAIFRVWEGGMAFHGGFMGVCLAVWYVSRKHKISLWRWADMAAIGAPLGIFCVRIANFINQELYGRPTDVAWGVIFPKIQEPHTPRHPSQLYEAALEGIAIFLIIRFATRHKKALTRPGVAAALFFLCYGCFRTFVEFFRNPDVGIAQVSPWFTRGMIYSIPMIIIGLSVLIWALRRPPVAPKRISDEP
jgi:phosphatidylglycerol:prolipoprotein diacylglycerol transferase